MFIAFELISQILWKKMIKVTIIANKFSVYTGVSSPLYKLLCTL